VRAWVAILAVSVLFGLMHLGFDFEALQWNVAINIFCMSVVLCVLREITGTIWSGTILHMLKNGLAYYLLFIVGTF
jgi:membrane protease YdiL (CAAX protease family)